MQIPSGLGYQGSEHLYRTPEGIKWSQNTQDEYPFSGLAHYPVSIRFTEKGMLHLKNQCKPLEGSSIISVYAYTKTPQARKVELFSLTPNLFGYIIAQGSDAIRNYSFDVNKRDSHPRAEALFKDFIEPMNKDLRAIFGERTRGMGPGLHPEETVHSFGADLCIGDMYYYDRYQFEVKANQVNESLFLEIDADPNAKPDDQFKLTLYQTSFGLRSLTATQTADETSPATSEEPLIVNEDSASITSLESTALT